MKKLLLIFYIAIIAFPAYGQTRFYLPSSGSADASPVFTTAGWGDVASATPDRIKCARYKRYTALTSKAGTLNGIATYLNRQYVSDPIAAQSISGTVYGQVRSLQTTKNTTSAITIRIVSKNGLTVRGTLLPITSDPTVFAAALTNRNTPVSTALTTQTASSEDRIVIEIGMNRTAGGNASSSQDFGDNAASDLTQGLTTETTASNPYIEFSQDIKFPSVTLID